MLSALLVLMLSIVHPQSSLGSAYHAGGAALHAHSESTVGGIYGKKK